jgi:hypothetical protein
LVTHMRANQFRIPRRHLNPFVLEDAPVDFDYWTRWSRRQRRRELDRGRRTG